MMDPVKVGTALVEVIQRTGGRRIPDLKKHNAIQGDTHTHVYTHIYFYIFIFICKYVKDTLISQKEGGVIFTE